jgi:hypothetical protein
MAQHQMTKPPKRPRDLNQWAKRMVDIATGDASDALKESEKRPVKSASPRKSKGSSGSAATSALRARQTK